MHFTSLILLHLCFWLDRLHEFDDQVQWVREGLARVIPIPLLSLFTGLELETMVTTINVIFAKTFSILTILVLEQSLGHNDDNRVWDEVWMVVDYIILVSTILKVTIILRGMVC